MAQNINLYAGLAPKRSRFSRAGAAAVGGALVGAVALLYAIDAHGLKQRRAELARLEADAQRIEKLLAASKNAAQGRQDRAGTEERDVAALEAVAAQLQAGALGATGGFSTQLKAFGRATADGVWLTGIKLDNAAHNLALEGKALEAARVPVLLAQLSRQPAFAGTDFATIDMKTAEDAGTRNVPASTVRFRIATANKEGAAPKNNAAAGAVAAAAVGAGGAR